VVDIHKPIGQSYDELSKHMGTQKFTNNKKQKRKGVVVKNYKTYRKKGITRIRPYVCGERLDYTVSISHKDAANGSPKKGDMIAMASNKDKWLINEEYFKKNYELVE
jgi:hypothetical protein